MRTLNFESVLIRFFFVSRIGLAFGWREYSNGDERRREVSTRISGGCEWKRDSLLAHMSTKRFRSESSIQQMFEISRYG
jgi:hypothetical protein